MGTDSLNTTISFLLSSLLQTIKTKQRKAYWSSTKRPTKRSSKKRSVGGKDGTTPHVVRKKAKLWLNCQAKTRAKKNRRLPPVIDTDMGSVSVIFFRSEVKPWRVLGTWRVCTACESGDDPLHFCQEANYVANTPGFDQEKYERRDAGYNSY